MVVAVWLLGVGTLKDLALIQLVGVLVGSYSSIFLATPLLVSLRERTDLVRTHTRRVMNRRKAAAGRETSGADLETTERSTEPAVASSAAAAGSSTAQFTAPEKPAPGARPRTGRPSGKRSARGR
jgi:preprotein translocase subunit SecF